MSFISKKLLVTAVAMGAAGLSSTGCGPGTGDPCTDANAFTYCAYPTSIAPGANDGGATLALANQGNASAMTANPIDQHPFLAVKGRSGTHANAYASGTYDTAGPIGNNPLVKSVTPVDFWQAVPIAGECLTQTFSSDGNTLYSLCADLGAFKLLAMDITDNFKRTGILSQPDRANPGESLAAQARDSSGGVYFHIMNDGNGDQILTTNGDEQVQIISPTGAPDANNGSDFGFTVVEEYDVKALLQVQTGLDATKITDVMIDWNHSNLIWFISNDGTVGLINRDGNGGTGSVDTLVLTSQYDDPNDDPDQGLQWVNEETQNSIAIDENGIYIVSDYALYRFSPTDANGGITQDWRSVNYGRGGDASGTFSEGSGTTPTAFGPDYIAITDFSDPVKIVVYSRTSGAEVCSQDVFEEGLSATENSLIGYYDASTTTGSIIVENNFGYSLSGGNGIPDDSTPIPEAEPGVARVDVSGAGVCSLVWDKDISSPSSILKLSTGSGIVYIYEPEYMDNDNSGASSANEIAWYLTGLDFATGNTEFRVLTGSGVNWNVNYAAISIGPDGKAYIGTFRGLISVEDQ